MLFEEQTFSKTDFTRQPLPRGEYEYCQFMGCDFSNTDLSSLRFLECGFEGCNLSLARLMKTALRDVYFKECKMLGLRFDDCDTFGLALAFSHCVLTHSTFYGLKLKKTVFDHSQLTEVDFTGCDLSGAMLAGCDLERAVFNNTNLEKADLRTAFHYSIDPENNRLKKAKFSRNGLSGLLDKYDILITE